MKKLTYTLTTLFLALSICLPTAALAIDKYGNLEGVSAEQQAQWNANKKLYAELDAKRALQNAEYDAQQTARQLSAIRAQLWLIQQQNAINAARR